jgi:hypothetical protein
MNKEEIEALKSFGVSAEELGKALQRLGTIDYQDDAKCGPQIKKTWLKVVGREEKL